MANWCSNYVQLIGTKEAINKVQQLFSEMAEKQEKEGCGQLPDFITEKKDYFFDIRVEDDSLYFETRWCPNVDNMLLVAKQYNIDFSHSYEETGCLIFGEVEYINGILKTYNLESEDFDLFEYDEEKDGWIFENEFYESDYEIKEILLERKR